jgi:hypothetical protein
MLAAGQLLCTLCTVPKCLEQGEGWQLVSLAVKLFEGQGSSLFTKEHSLRFPEIKFCEYEK